SIGFPLLLFCCLRCWFELGSLHCGFVSDLLLFPLVADSAVLLLFWSLVSVGCEFKWCLLF
ncbi:hypothetical protein U1Q18_040217, partial [Sarracenia purpurea var. burkii]